MNEEKEKIMTEEKDSAVVYRRWFRGALTSVKNKKEITKFLWILAEYLAYGEIPENLKNGVAYSFFKTCDIEKTVERNDEKYIKRCIKRKERETNENTITIKKYCEVKLRTYEEQK